jgi:glycosyltransferase involved in cell wall biosynthesis
VADITAKWRIIGRNAHAVSRYTAGDDRIEVTGPVPDAIPALSAARVVVVPLLSGSGTRIKILEAWAAGRAVVSTTIGAEGLGARHGRHLLIADSAEAFAEAVSKLLGDDELRRAIGNSGRALYEQQFTWPSAWAGLTAAGI